MRWTAQWRPSVNRADKPMSVFLRPIIRRADHIKMFFSPRASIKAPRL